MLIQVILASLLITAASLVGVFTLWKSAGRIITANLNLLISLAAGVFIVFVYGLIEEAIHESSSIGAGIGWILAGLVIVWVVVKIAPHSHHHESQDHECRLDARKLLIGDSLHNIGDGVLIAVAFTTSIPLGIAAAISIFIHELVQEMSEFFVLKEAGYSTKKALQINFLTASTLLIGSIGGYLLLSKFSAIEVPILGIAAGAILALLLQDLIPHSVERAREHKCITKHIAFALIGILIMIGVNVLTAKYLPDTHVHGGEIYGEHHDDEHGYDEKAHGDDHREHEETHHEDEEHHDEHSPNHH